MSTEQSIRTWYATPAMCVDWKCEREHLSQYPAAPLLCPRPGCGSREFTRVDPAVAAAARRRELIERQKTPAERSYER